MIDRASTCGDTDLFGHGPSEARAGRQLPLPLGWRSALTADDRGIIVGSSNRDAVGHVLGHAAWTVPASILLGPPGSGRSMLGRLFMESGGMVLIDDWDGMDEEAVFHDWNRARDAGGHMLVIPSAPDILSSVRLADLVTRFGTAPVVTIDEPDADVARDLIDQLLMRRGVHAAPQLGGYVAARIERTYAAIHAAVAAIDAYALSVGGTASIRTARAALIAAKLYIDADDAAESMEPA